MSDAKDTSAHLKGMHDKESTDAINQLGIAQGNNQYVVFGLGEEEYGVSIQNVQEIIGYNKPRELHNVPDYFEGVINLRDMVIPVIDIRKKFGMELKEHNRMSVIIILEVSSRRVGITVDLVNDVLNIAEESIQPSPAFNSSIHVDYIQGIAKIDDRLIVLLNLEKVIAAEKLEAVAEIQEPAASSA